MKNTQRYSNVFLVDEFLVDGTRNCITIDGQTHSVEPKAMKVLVYLARHHDRVVSVNELLETVWKGSVVTPQTVQRSIYLIRRILNSKKTEIDYISTFSKAGYQLSVAPVFIAQAQDKQNAQTPMWIALFFTLLIAIASLFWLMLPANTEDMTPQTDMVAAYALHPDGQHLAFIQKNNEGYWDLYVKNIKGAAWRAAELGKSTINLGLDWSVDGSQLTLFTHHNDYFIWQLDINLTTRKSGQLTELKADPDFNYKHWSSLSSEAILVSKRNKHSSFHQLGSLSADGQLFSPYNLKGNAPLASAFNHLVAYVHIDLKQHHIRYYNTETHEHLEQVHTQTDPISSLSWLPDGTGVLYVSMNKLFVHYLNGEHNALSLPIKGDITAISTSKQDGMLYFLESVSNFKLMKKPIDGCCYQPIAANMTLGHSAVFDSKGERFAYVSEQTGLPQLWVSEGEQQVQLTQFDKRFELTHLNWSPNNQWLSFKADNDIYVHYFVLNATKQLITNELYVTPIGFSKDSDSIYYTDTNNRATRLWLKSHTGNNQSYIDLPNNSQVVNIDGTIYYLAPESGTLYQIDNNASIEVDSHFPKDAHLLYTNPRHIFYNLPRASQIKNILSYELATHRHSDAVKRLSYYGEISSISQQGIMLVQAQEIVQQHLVRYPLKELID